MKSINPATEELIRQFTAADDDAVENRLRMADEAQRGWRRTGLSRRADLLRKLKRVLLEEEQAASQLITREMGKPIRQSRAEIEKCARVCDYYADNAESMLADRLVETDAGQSFVRYEALGAILCVMPWNFPFWQVLRFAVPATMAGNATILKHASNVCGVALKIEELFVKAGFPIGLMLRLFLPPEDAEVLVDHEVIRGVTLTGSDKAGRALAQRAGKALKKTVLELGGSDAFIVLADAEISQAAKAAAKSRTQNSGQSCIAAKRFVVEKSIIDEFTAALDKEFRGIEVGDPMEESTDVGPLARDDLRENLHRQVTESVEAGASIRTGGELPDGTGYFYPPTILENVTPGMPAFDEETFGPVAAIVTAADSDEAIALANRSRYGLGASLWTRETARSEDLTRDIESGCVFVNDIVKSDPRLPFGGVKDSGYGRELSVEGIREFVNCKTVSIA